MPLDQKDFGDDDEEDRGNLGAKTRFKEFDCPSCSANNPVDPPFGEGDEVLCNFCGSEYRVRVSDEGRAKFKEL